MKTPALKKTKDVDTEPAPRMNLGGWFWGAILVMAGVTFLLVAVAFLRQPQIVPPFEQDQVLKDNSDTRMLEISAADLNDGLLVTKKAALAAVQTQIGPLLDAAYEPVYAAIPVYADYHYSVWGEYAELTSAAMGDLGAKIQETLFNGLDQRLEQVSRDLDTSFNRTFQDELQKRFGAEQERSAPLDELSHASLENVRNRMLFTAPVASVLTIGTLVGGKVAAKVMGKKIAVKLAAKAAAKTTGKWTAAGAGAGAAGAACAWSGPGAALCAAAGGVGVWIITDAGIIMLDEYWNRDEFELDLRAMVDFQKAEHVKYFEQAIFERAEAIGEASDMIVQHHDFTLRELAGEGNAAICKAVDDLTAQYEALRHDLTARTPDAIQELRSLATAQRGNLSTDRFAREILENLGRISDARAIRLLISGNLPLEYRADREVSALVSLNEMPLTPVRVEATEDKGFLIRIDTDVNVQINRPITIHIAFEQHLRLKRHRHFAVHGAFDPLAGNAEAESLQNENADQMSIWRVEDPSSENTAPPTFDHDQTILVNTTIRAEPVGQLKTAPKCQ